MYKRERPKADPPKHAPAADSETTPKKRDRSKQILLVATVAAFVAALMILGHDEDEEFITLEAAASAQNETVTVSGTTNLPDGAILLITILSADTETEVLGGAAEVDDGAFHTSIALPADSGDAEADGRLVVEVTFEIVMEDQAQPPELIERFGAIGARMTGETVVQAEHGRRLVWRLPVTR